MTRKVLLILTCLGASGLVDAQMQAPQSPVATDGGIQEVIVTATRREESLSRVPESLAVFDAASLDKQGIRSAADLAEMAPGVDLHTQPGFETNISIRGISNTAGVQTTGSATTGIYLDDTPVQIRSIGFGPGDSLPDIFDLARVEVLRGPQGTLFGAGSEGGAIRFIAQEPSLRNASGYRRAEAGFTHDGAASYELGAAQGGPIINDVLGFRVSAHYRHEGGFIDRIPFGDGVAGSQTATANANYSDTVSGRAALLWAPTQNLKVTPSLYLRQTHLADSGLYWRSILDPTGNVLQIISNPAKTRYVNGSGAASPDTNRSALAAVKLEWATGPVALISNTSYYYRSERNFSDSRRLLTNTLSGVWQSTDGSGNPLSAYFGQSNEQILRAIFATPGYYNNTLIDNTQSAWTQELRLQSTDTDARLTWVGGIFYADTRQMNSEGIREPYLNAETGIPLSSNDVSLALFNLPLVDGQYSYSDRVVSHDAQLAGFGEVNVMLTARLRATAGLRAARTYTDYHDARDGPFAGGPGDDRGKHYETPKTPRYILAYQFDPDNMVYGSMSEGFRIGGVNRSVDPTICGAALLADGFVDQNGNVEAPKTYRSDRVRSYELGVKLRPTANFRLATSVYHIDWLDIIRPVDLSGSISPLCASSITANLGRAVSKGVDLEASYAPVAKLLLSLMLSYDDAKFIQTIPGSNGFNLVTGGWTLGQTPWTIVGSGELKFTGPFGVHSYFRADADFRSKNRGLTQITDPASANFNPYVRPDSSSLDLRLRYGVQLSSWDVSLFVDNALNIHPIINVQNDSPGAPTPYGSATRPLTAGITAQSRF